MSIDKRCSFGGFFSNENVINRMVIYLMKFSFKSLECEKFKTNFLRLHNLPTDQTLIRVIKSPRKQRQA